MHVAAVIFDMDGLMVDTEPVYKAAWQQAAADLGYDLDDEWYATLVGRPTEACERILMERWGTGFPLGDFRRRWPVLWRDGIACTGVQKKPGLLELLEFVKGARLPMAVATSSEAEYASFTLSQAAVRDWFDAIVSGDQIAHGKPAPDIYLEAARRLAVDPATCVALEDSEAGIQAVARAGMTGILVPHWPVSADAVRAAFRVVDTLHDARQVLASLIAGDGVLPAT